MLIDVPALETERVERTETISQFASFLDMSEPTYHLIKRRGYAAMNTAGRIKKVLPQMVGKIMTASELASYL